MNNQYVQCCTFKDLYELIYDEKYPLLKIKKNDTSDRAKKLKKQMKMAKEQWKVIVDQKKNLFDQQGYIGVYIDEDGSITLNGGGPGRPQKLESKDIKISLRLDEATYKKLKKYCKDNRVVLSEAVRTAVHVLVKD